MRRGMIGIVLVLVIGAAAGMLWISQKAGSGHEAALASPGGAAPVGMVDPTVWKSQMHIVEAQALQLFRAERVEFWRAHATHVRADWTPSTDQLDLTIQSYAQEMHHTTYLIEVHIQKTEPRRTGIVTARILQTPTDRLLAPGGVQSIINQAPNAAAIAEEVAPQIMIAPQQAAAILLQGHGIDPAHCTTIHIELALTTTSTPPEWYVEAPCETGSIRGIIHAGTGMLRK